MTGKTGSTDHHKLELLTTRQKKYTFKEYATKRYILDTYKFVNSREGWSVNFGIV